MPIELGSSLNGAADWVCGSPVVYGALKNPIVTALIITVIALIVVFVVFRRELDGVGWRRGLKAGLWVMFAVSALVFVHYYALGRATRRSSQQQVMSDVADELHDHATGAYPNPVVGRGEAGGPAGEDEEAQGEAPAGNAGGLRLDDVAIPPDVGPAADDE